jgi:hypothetical protein
MTSMFAHTNQHTVLVTATLKAISTHQLSASVWYKILLLEVFLEKKTGSPTRTLALF